MKSRMGATENVGWLAIASAGVFVLTSGAMVMEVSAEPRAGCVGGGRP